MLTFLRSPSKPSTKQLEKQPEQEAAEPAVVSEHIDTQSDASSVVAATPASPQLLSPKDTPLPDSPLLSPTAPGAQDASPYSKQSNSDARRFSFRSLPFLSSRSEQQKSVISTESERVKREKKIRATSTYARRLAPRLSNSDKRAKQSALVVRSLIVGFPAAVSPKTAKPVSKNTIGRVKSQLLQPKTANKVIAHLRTLSVTDTPSGGDAEKQKYGGLIHAVCLDVTEAEAHERHFSRLTDSDDVDTTRAIDFPSVITASVSSLATVIADMHLVNLITAPNMGLGAPGNAEGLFAGAVPTAETVLNGIQQITPQLMALGFATGKAIFPDHSAVHPPTDRISVLTYWWGLEVVLPPTTLSYLSSAKSISGAVINFLTALSVINEGVREILPFVRYIGQFIDFEFDSIKKENRGQGVVCTATWIMPAAMVPRPWDFPPAPPPEVVAPENETPGADDTVTVAPTTKPSTDAPRPSSAYSVESEVIGDHPVPSLPHVLPELIVSSPPTESHCHEDHDMPNLPTQVI